MTSLCPFIRNYHIDLQLAGEENFENFDNSFITSPIANLDGILDTLSDDTGLELLRNIIVKTCGYNVSHLSANDIVYNYLINTNNISKIIYEELVKKIKNKKTEITNCVYNDLTGRGEKISKLTLFNKILKCIENEYKTYGLGGTTVVRFLCDSNPMDFGEESFTLSYFDELTC